MFCSFSLLLSISLVLTSTSISSVIRLTPRDRTMLETKQCTFSSGRIFCDFSLTSFGKKQSTYVLSGARLMASEGSTIKGLFSHSTKANTNTVTLVLGEHDVQIFSIMYPLSNRPVEHFWLSFLVSIGEEQRIFKDYSPPSRKIRDDEL